MMPDAFPSAPVPDEWNLPEGSPISKFAGRMLAADAVLDSNAADARKAALVFALAAATDLTHEAGLPRFLTRVFEEAVQALMDSNEGAVTDPMIARQPRSGRPKDSSFETEKKLLLAGALHIRMTCLRESEKTASETIGRISKRRPKSIVQWRTDALKGKFDASGVVGAWEAALDIVHLVKRGQMTIDRARTKADELARGG